MNGFAGLPQQKIRRLAGTGSRGLDTSLSRVNAGPVAGQAVLIADPRQKNGFEVSGRETGTSYFVSTVGFMGSEGISLNVRER